MSKRKRLTAKERLSCALDELEYFQYTLNTSTSKAMDDRIQKNRQAIRAYVFRLLRRSISGGVK